MRAFTLLLAAALCCGSVHAAVPREINYQGNLAGAGGQPIAGSVQMVFRLYNVADNGAALHSETQTVTVANGVFNVLIGAQPANPLTLPFDEPYWLGVTVGNDAEMAPRQPVAAAPYAIRAASAEALASGGGAGQVLAGTAGAPAWTGSPALSGDLTVLGRVGIGTNSPISRLHTSDSDPAGTTFVLENLFGVQSRKVILSNYGAIGGGLYWSGLDSASTSSLLAPNLFVLRSAGGLVFSGSGLGEHMRIETSGNVGIGTNAPSAPLEVNGRAIFNVHGSNGFRITPNTDADIGVLNVTNAANTVNWLTVGNGGQVIMNGSGNVGIGTSNPLVKLEVASLSSATVSLRVHGIADFMDWVRLANVAPYVSGVRPICVDLSGFITECSSSSLRHKTDVGNFRSGLDVIGSLEPITFRWKSDGSLDFGLAAEAVEKVMPGLVFYNKDGEVDGVRYDRVGVVLVNAVNEQQAQIEAQQKQMDQQRAEIIALKQIVCAIKPGEKICQL